MNSKSSCLSIAAACLWAASTPSFAQAGGDTLQKIKETGAITLGYRESSVPFSFLDSQQKPVGISMDLCAAIVEKVKQQVTASQYQIFDLYVLKKWSVSKVASTLGISSGRVYLAKHRIAQLVKRELNTLKSESP